MSLDDKAQDTTEQPAIPPPSEDVDQVVAQPSTWDEETLEVVEEFLQEGSDGLDKADTILLSSEDAEVDPENINSLFRTFHTIKGVAGFIELHEITDLAHAAESVLDQIRKGSLNLNGVALDLIFDATKQMRTMLDAVRTSVEHGQDILTSQASCDLVQQLRALVAGQPKQASPIATKPVASHATQTPEVPAPSESKEPTAPMRPQKAQQIKLKETLKIDLERVDRLVEMIGELVIVESMVVHEPQIANLSSTRVRNYLSQLAKITRDLQDIGMRMRTVPVRGVFQKMARMVRDLSHQEGKHIRANLFGESTEMDRSMVEQMADPLVHMIRNAVDHALEGQEEREQAGKPPVGTITLSAYHEGGSIIIEVTDDGRGLNRELILHKAIERGVVTSNDTLSDEDVFHLIFAPGFSTAQQVTQISGRGVGLDVVRRNVEAMRGRVSISSTQGKGTTFKMVLPLTLAIIDGMIVSCGDEQYIIPTLSIIESVRPSASMLFSFAGGGAMVKIRNESLPLLRLDHLLGIHRSKAGTDPTQGQIIVLETTGCKLALVVDEVVTQQQVVIKTLGSGLPDTRFLSGAAILSTGHVGLILNVEEFRNLTHRGRFNECAPQAHNPMTPHIDTLRGTALDHREKMA